MGKTNNFEKSCSLIEEIDALVKITGLKQTHIQNLFLRNLNQEKFQEFKSYMQVTKCKVCPKCLIEKGYYNGFWEITFITICPEHHCLLIDKCPKCNKFLNWNRQNVFKCNCNYDLRKCPTIIGNNNSLMLSTLITSKMEEENIEYRMNNPLYKLDVLSILKLIRFISLKIVFSINHGGMLPFKRMENLELDKVINRAFETFNNWPNNFLTFLDNLKQKSLENHKGITREFGSFYREMNIGTIVQI